MFLLKNQVLQVNVIMRMLRYRMYILNVNIYFHQTVPLGECNLRPKGLRFLRRHVITRVYRARRISIESRSCEEKDN